MKKERREDKPVNFGIEQTTEQPVCPVCGEKLIQEKCKVVCRSNTCVYRIIYNCSEF